MMVLTMCLLQCLPGSAQGSEQVVRVPKPETEGDVRYQYYYDLLEVALEATVESHGPFQLQQAAHAMSFQGRGVRYLKQGREVDVLWMMTSSQRERDLMPVRVPLLRGMLGYRVFLIRQDDQKLFSQVLTLDELRTLRAGQGSGWPDVAILEANNLTVTIGRNYENLFSMLVHGRFDYFPRGICEAWPEERAHDDLPIVVEQHLLLHYPTAIYFFLNRSDGDLAARIEVGLHRCLKDGAFDRIFTAYHGTYLEAAKLSQRRIFRLQNPLLPAATPLDQEQLWLDPVPNQEAATP